MNSRMARALLLGLTVAAAIVAGCASNASEATDGTLAFRLELAPGITLSTLSYVVTQPIVLSTPRTGSVDLSQSKAIQFVVGGLPASDGYTITLTGTTDGPQALTCLGTASFGVAANTTTEVTVALACSAGEADAGDNGSIAVNGSATVVASCAAVTSLSASPSEANVGATMQLSGAGIDANGDSSDVTLTWSLGGSSLGSLSTTSGGSTVFTCAAPGHQTVTLTASVGSGPACPTQSTQSVTLTCDAVCTWSLSAAPMVATGVGPDSVAAGDLNGDGKEDLAVANAVLGLLPGSVSVLLGNGDGTFHPQSTYPSGGTGPSAIAIGDVNGDFKPDLAVANYNSNSVGVLLGKGDGTFAAAALYTTTGSLPASVAIGDLNGDGKQDLVVADFGSAAVGPEVLLGNGDGTFQAGVAYATDPGGANSVAIADVNGDAKPDLVVPTDSTNAVSVLLGNGDGTFKPYLAYAVGSTPWSVAIADLNRDGSPDLVVANSNLGGASGSVSVLAGNGDGTFQKQVVYPAGSLPYFVAVSDLNGDGKPDLTVANNGANDVGILLGRGDGTFLTQRTYATGLYPAAVAIRDLNGDGRPDLAVANQGSNTVSVQLGTCGM